MKAPHLRTRFSFIRLMIAFVVLAVFLAMIRSAYDPRRYFADLELDAVSPADHTEPAMNAHVERLTSSRILRSALNDQGLSAVKRLKDASDPEAELRRLVSATVIDVKDGSLMIFVEGDSTEEATAIVSAVADAYVQDQGPSRIVKPPGQTIGLTETRAPLDLPWHVAVATILAILASATTLWIPARWFRPGLWFRPIVTRFRESPRRFLRRVLVRVALIPPALLVLSFFGFFPWSTINCSESDVDINSGRIRHRGYLLFIPVTSTVRDSALTEALSPQDRAGQGEDWQTVTTLSPGLHHSPHYRFHGAIHQIHELEMCWESGKMTPEARRASASRVLGLWRIHGSYFQAEEYLQAVWETSQDAARKGKTMDVNDLPK